MSLLSLNVRGLGKVSRAQALSNLTKDTGPAILFLQETMCEDTLAIQKICNVLPDWEVAAISSHGQSGGLVAAWNPNFFDLHAFYTPWGLLLKGSICSNHKSISLLNVYAPYRERQKFWTELSGSGLMDLPDIIIAGDLNFSYLASEIWGISARMDDLGDFFLNMLMEKNLIDVLPHKLSPTWTNGRYGAEGVHKRIDRFLVKSTLLAHFPMHRSWVHTSKFSDHWPVLLQMEQYDHLQSTPFKFNASWLEEASFCQMVKKLWENCEVFDPNPVLNFCFKLKNLKVAVIRWIKEKKNADKDELQQLESQLRDAIDANIYDSSSEEAFGIMKKLELKKEDLILQEEKAWRLKSRATWIALGDKNTKFFHAFASARRRSKHIWEIQGNDGMLCSGMENLKSEAFSYFKNIYADPGDHYIDEQFVVADLFPRFLEEHEAVHIQREVTLVEIEQTLKAFAKDKAPGPDGWPVELYLHFFKLMGDELLELVKYSMKNSYIPGGLNSTFVTLIPKKDKPATFGDFRPIALCNLLYKLISKIIADRLKRALSTHISEEQFGFLEGRQIHDAIGITQELIHSIKIHKRKAMLLKMDLVKAYDRANWSFIRLILIKIGMPPLFIKWIMACIRSINIVVLVNGSPTDFFSCSRGLRQGCPLSPLLFILIMDGFSRLVKRALMDGKIKGIKLIKDVIFTHVMFADDVLVGGIDSVEEWGMYKNIIQTFCRATGMLVSEEKSSFLHLALSDDQLRSIQTIMPYNCSNLEKGFKYLGYLLKPNNYQIRDWQWLLKKIEDKIAHWSYRFLSIGGKLILVNSVLSSIPVYWFSLMEVPSSVIKNIKSFFFNFLWTGTAKSRNIPMVAAETLARPHKFGGWGIKDLEAFNIALRLKSCWRGIYGDSLWSRIIHSKYLKNDVNSWMRNPILKSWNFSPIWRGFMKVFHWIKCDLAWHVGCGSQIKVGVDPIIGLEHDYLLPTIIPQYLDIIGLSTLDKIHHQNNGRANSQKWFTAQDLGISGYLARIWENYTNKLNSAGVHLSNSVDKLVWAGNTGNGSVTAKSAYKRIIQQKYIFPPDWWYVKIWKWHIPLKLKCFTWLILQNKLKTWDNLCKQGWSGPNYCSLCKTNAETRLHLFVQCSFSRRVWDMMSIHFKITNCWAIGDFNQCFLNWYRQCKKLFYLAVCIPWSIWHTRNCVIFRNSTPDYTQCWLTALKMFNSCKVDEMMLKTERISTFSLIVDRPVLFFYGASQAGMCAIGGVIYLNDSHYFSIKLNCGQGTNMKAELIALWCVLKVANIFGLPNLKVFGDSRVTIKWAEGKFKLNVLNLRHWASRVLLELSKQHDISFEHIYRAHNSLADKLSKQALDGCEGYLFWEEWIEDSLQECGSIYFYD